jgi:hypothetical protein
LRLLLPRLQRLRLLQPHRLHHKLLQEQLALLSLKQLIRWLMFRHCWLLYS